MRVGKRPCKQLLLEMLHHVGRHPLDSQSKEGESRTPGPAACSSGRAPRQSTEPGSARSTAARARAARSTAVDGSVRTADSTRPAATAGVQPDSRGYPPPVAPGQPGSYGPPGAPRGYLREPEPVKSGSFTGIIAAVVLIIVAAAAIYGLKFSGATSEPKVTPDKVVEGFLEAKKDKKLTQAETYLCKESVENITNASNNKQLRSAFEESEVQDMALWGVPPTPKQLQKRTVQVANVEEKEAKRDTRIVKATLTPIPKQSSSTEGGFGVEDFMLGGNFEFVLIREANEWKIDLHQTARREMGDSPMKLLNPGGGKP